jgi:uncharacterized protein (DUF1499 family)
MKKMSYILAAIVIAVIVVFGGMSCAGRRPPQTGLVRGQLRPCPSSPNCVSSEAEKDKSAWIEPLTFEGTPEDAWERLGAAVEKIGGKVQENKGNYLWATFTSTVFRFVDDLELRMDAENKVIHVRSGSRVGHSDLGVNRKRVEKLREAFGGE